MNDYVSRNFDLNILKEDGRKIHGKDSSYANKDDLFSLLGVIALTKNTLLSNRPYYYPDSSDPQYITGNQLHQIVLDMKNNRGRGDVDCPQSLDLGDILPFESKSYNITLERVDLLDRLAVSIKELLNAYPTS